MLLKFLKNTVLFLIFLLGISCNSRSQNAITKNNKILNQTSTTPITEIQDDKIIIGANQTNTYLPLLNGKQVGIVANQTSVIFNSKTYTHLVDSLVALNIDIKNVFAPEHGFRGTADAGEKIKDGIDIKTGLPIISLYGNNKKPNEDQLKNIDVMIFDIQDVGARFYTYISTLHFVMEACAEQNITLIVLDRPNPNGHYIDGPILEVQHQSFVGMHPVPVVHGMTIGEYAKMINGEEWLNNAVKTDLKVITIKNYTHQTPYSLPIKPSPNLPNDKSINLYPSLCFFEGTNISIGRGTDKQFQVVGSPFFNLKQHTFQFTPHPNTGAKYPKHQDKTCNGYDLSNEANQDQLNLKWLIEFYNANKQYASNEPFFNDFFTKLAGTKMLQSQIELGLTEQNIRESWLDDLNAFKKLRKNYLLYN